MTLEESKKQLDQRQDFLDMLLAIMPEDDINVRFTKASNNFSKTEINIMLKIQKKELSEQQLEQLISLYKQFEKLTKDILNNN